MKQFIILLCRRIYISYFQLIFCFLFNYHTEVNLFSFSWGDRDSIHLCLVLVDKLFMCRIFPCSVVSIASLNCTSHLSQQHAKLFILKDQKNLVWKEIWAVIEAVLPQGSLLVLGSGICEGRPSVAPQEYSVRKEKLVQLRSTGIWKLQPLKLFVCEWLDLKDLCFKFRSHAKLILGAIP